MSSVNLEINPVGRKSAIVDSEHLDELTSLDKETVAEWLGESGYGEYKDQFLDHNVDGECIPLLTSSDLQMIGVNKVGDRVRLLKDLREFRVAKEIQRRTKPLMKWKEFRWFCSPFDAIWYTLTPSFLEVMSESGCFGTEKWTINIGSIVDIQYDSQGCAGCCCYSTIEIIVPNGESNHTMQIANSQSKSIYEALNNCWEAFQANRMARGTDGMDASS